MEASMIKCYLSVKVIKIGFLGGFLSLAGSQTSPVVSNMLLAVAGYCSEKEVIIKQLRDSITVLELRVERDMACLQQQIEDLKNNRIKSTCYDSDQRLQDFSGISFASCLGGCFIPERSQSAPPQLG